MRVIKSTHDIILYKRLFQYRRFCCLPIAILLLTTHYLPAQGVEDFTQSLKKKRTFYFTWDSKATFISNEYAQIKSVKLGLDFGGKTKFGLGFNWYKGDIIRPFTTEAGLQTANLKFRYVTLFTEYVYFLNKRWEATIPAQLGMGLLQYNKEFTKDAMPKAGGLFLIYEPSSTIMYRFLRYFGVGLGVGYRLVLLTGSNPQEEKFTSPVLSFRTKIYFEYAWQDIKQFF